MAPTFNCDSVRMVSAPVIIVCCFCLVDAVDWIPDLRLKIYTIPLLIVVVLVPGGLVL